MTAPNPADVLIEQLETMHQRCTDPCKNKKAALGCDCDAARQAAVALQTQPASSVLKMVTAVNSALHWMRVGWR